MVCVPCGVILMRVAARSYRLKKKVTDGNAYSTGCPICLSSNFAGSLNAFPRSNA